jgi:tRNA A-37 threonylcarbamoyl transferase component Bud32
LVDIEELVASCDDTHHRVFPIEVDGQRYWVKRAAKNFPNPVAWLLGSVSRRVASAGTAHEIKALAALRKRGFQAPAVVFSNSGYMVLSDLGPALNRLIRDAAAPEANRLAREAGGTLRRLHDAGGWHGSARLHNMTESGGEIGFIDLENTVAFWLPGPVLRAWDLWQLCVSVTVFDDDNSTKTASCLRGYGNGAVLRGLWMVSALLAGPYFLLKPFQPWLKREIRQIVMTIHAIFSVGWRLRP